MEYIRNSDCFELTEFLIYSSCVTMKSVQLMIVFNRYLIVRQTDKLYFALTATTSSLNTLTCVKQMSAC